MNVLFDTGVIRVLLEREPHLDAASKLFALVDNGRITGSICATTAYDGLYIAAKSFGSRRARDQVHGLLGLFEVAPVGRDVLDSALDIDFADNEDAVLRGRAPPARPSSGRGIATTSSTPRSRPTGSSSSRWCRRGGP